MSANSSFVILMLFIIWVNLQKSNCYRLTSPSNSRKYIQNQHVSMFRNSRSYSSTQNIAHEGKVTSMSNQHDQDKSMILSTNVSNKENILSKISSKWTSRVLTAMLALTMTFSNSAITFAKVGEGNRLAKIHLRQRITIDNMKFPSVSGTL